jgi:hypothetical protein
MASGGLITDYISSGAGAPSGAPSVVSGEYAFYQNTTNGALYVWGLNGTPAWSLIGAAPLASASYRRTAGDYTTTSTTYVAVDATNLNFTITTGARRVLISFTGSVSHTANGGVVYLDVAVDGTQVGGSVGLVLFQTASAAQSGNASFTYVTDALTAGSHTFELMWKGAVGTATLFGGATASRFAVVELYA